MARTPLLQLSDITLGFGGDPLLSAVELVVNPGDRMALVGRNGSGKSTLMRVMAGLSEPDAGGRAKSAGIKLRVILDLDTGTKRTGVASGAPALALAQQIDKALLVSSTDKQRRSVDILTSIISQPIRHVS